MQEIANDSLEAGITAYVSRMMAQWRQILKESETVTEETGERVTEVFDTSLPADSMTGLPPLLSRTTERSGRQSKTQLLELNDGMTNDAISAAGTSEVTEGYTMTNRTHSTDDSVEYTENREENKTPVVMTIARLCAGGAIALFMLWLLMTVTGTIKQFSNNN